MRDIFAPIMRIMAKKGLGAAAQSKAGQRMQAWLDGETTEPLEIWEETGAELEEELCSKTCIQRSYDGHGQQRGNDGGGRLH